MAARSSAWGAGVAVVLAAVSGALTNELHGGWPWWVADVVVVLGAAALAARLAGRAGRARPASGTVNVGTVSIGRDNHGVVRTVSRR